MASGTQQIKLLEWIPRSKPCSLPQGAVSGGFTLEGEETYVARCGNTCGAYIPSKGVASVPFKGIEELREYFDILVCRDPEIIFWTDSNSGENIPDFPVAIDDKEVVENEFRHHLLDLKRIYITRTRPNTPLTGLKTVTEDREVKINVDFKYPMLGKYMNDCMHLAYEGKECYLNEYQVLCAYRPPTIQRTIPSPYTWMPATKEHVPENSFVGGKTADGNNICLVRVSSPLYSSSNLQWCRSQINKHSKTVGTSGICYIGFISPRYGDYLVNDDTSHDVGTLVKLPIPNTLQELSRYAILQSTYGVPRRINELPLPTHMKEYCQLRKRTFRRYLS